MVDIVVDIAAEPSPHQEPTRGRCGAQPSAMAASAARWRAKAARPSSGRLHPGAGAASVGDLVDADVAGLVQGCELLAETESLTWRASRT